MTGTLDRVGIRIARAAGLGVNVWTENDPARMQALIAAGATGIFTDYPNRLRDVLAHEQAYRRRVGRVFEAHRTSQSVGIQRWASKTRPTLRLVILQGNSV